MKIRMETYAELDIDVTILVLQLLVLRKDSVEVLVGQLMVLGVRDGCNLGCLEGIRRQWKSGAGAHREGSSRAVLARESGAHRNRGTEVSDQSTMVDRQVGAGALAQVNKIHACHDDGDD